jgi:hypothetical protein
MFEQNDLRIRMNHAMQMSRILSRDGRRPNVSGGLPDVRVPGIHSCSSTTGPHPVTVVVVVIVCWWRRGYGTSCVINRLRESWPSQMTGCQRRGGAEAAVAAQDATRHPRAPAGLGGVSSVRKVATQRRAWHSCGGVERNCCVQRGNQALDRCCVQRLNPYDDPQGKGRSP